MTASAITASLIIIGNEILSGRTQDKNIQFIANGLGALGIVLREVRIICDDETEIITTVNSIRSRYDYVFTTGGIGPTHDDITSAAIAKAFGVKLLLHPEAVRRLERHYAEGELNEARLKMAYIPENAALIDNPVSNAPGFIIENVYVMAGVPRIMQAMFDGIKHQLTGGDIVQSEQLSVYLPEGKIAKGFSDLQEKYPAVEMGSYPFIRHERLGTSLVLRSTNTTLLMQARTELEEFIDELQGERVEELAIESNS
jgi:molybdenum cofactor synthesis domain-containing protein